MEVGPDFSDFLKAHIEKITESDDVKHCTFAEGSEVKELLQNCTPDNFVETSKQLAERLYDIMNANIDIPAADVEPVRMGQWERCFEDWRQQIEGDKCSACGFEYYGTGIRRFHYCANCGAKMDLI